MAQITYDPEEVQELFDVVFKLSAKDITDKLIKVRNRVEIAKRRWFWELLQNAKDSVKPSEQVSVKLVLSYENGNPYVEFLHNGNPFRYQDAKNLIFPYSDKAEEENTDTSGRFGTGFLATHILSKKIRVKGIYVRDNMAYDFLFTLDRSGSNKTEIAESINKTWQEFRTNRFEKVGYAYNQNGFETSFRYDLDADTVSLVSDSIRDFQTSLPYVLAFIPKIKSVSINDGFEGYTLNFQRNLSETRRLTEKITEFVIDKTLSKHGISSVDKIKLIICSDTEIDIGFEIYQNNGTTYIKKFEEHQPLLFCQFPLIGANDFKFPTIINSVDFQPKEERDGVWLSNTDEGLVNQKLFEKVVLLYKILTDYASNQKWQHTYLLLKSLKERIEIADFNYDWFKNNIQEPIKTHAKQIPLVDNPERGRIPIQTNDFKVFFAYHPKEEIRDRLWDFISAIHPESVTSKSEVHFWYEVIWDDCPNFSVRSFSKLIASFKNVENLQDRLKKDRENSISWLDEFIAFITKYEQALLNDIETAILPNQFGQFKRKDELYLDDGSIDDELKIILAKIGSFKKGITDWRYELLEKKIYLELPANKTRSIKDIGLLITENIKDLLKTENPPNELRDLFSRVLNWLNDNPEIARENFKGLRTETLLYKTTDENKLKYFTDLLRKDRDGEVSVEQLAKLDSQKIKLLQDPDLELKIRLGEQVLADQKREKEEFEFKKQAGNIFEKLFHQIINTDNRLRIEKVEGEEDFIVINKLTNKKYYIELKSIRFGERQIYMTHKQAKKAYAYPETYFLCIIAKNDGIIDETYFKVNSRFDGTIGKKLANKVKTALEFEAPENGILVEFEDDLLRFYNKYRYKFGIRYILWGQDNFETFKTRLLEADPTSSV